MRRVWQIGPYRLAGPCARAAAHDMTSSYALTYLAVAMPVSFALTGIGSTVLATGLAEPRP
jgi:hypothetical protein